MPDSVPPAASAAPRSATNGPGYTKLARAYPTGPELRVASASGTDSWKIVSPVASRPGEA